MAVINPVFVVGTPRSGTTLLAVTLGRHSRLAMMPETAFYDEVAPKLGKATESDLRAILESWTRLAEFDLRACDVVGACGGSFGAAAVLAAILKLYARRHGKPLTGEKTPQHLQHAKRILEDFPNARMICIQRDGRDVALSLAAMPWWREGLLGAAALWSRDLKLAADLCATFPERARIIRLDDFLIKPERSLRAVMAFVGLAYEPNQLAETSSPVVLARSLAWKGDALRGPNPAWSRRRREMCSVEDFALLNTVLYEELKSLDYIAQ